MSEHIYNVEIIWTGNLGEGTKAYDSYSRNHTIGADNKTIINGSADSEFRGDPNKYNPEELLLASISSCHMLWYLHLCTTNEISVNYYADNPQGNMSINSNGGGQFTSVILRPKIIINDKNKKTLAESLHAKAHHKCFISNSVNFPIPINPSIESKSSN